jgi:aspartyl/asparaginyl-tRNA synthetase
MSGTESYISYLQTDEAQAVFRLSQAVMDALREYLGGCGFVEFLAPLVSTVTDPGLREPRGCRFPSTTAGHT